MTDDAEKRHSIKNSYRTPCEQQIKDRNAVIDNVDDG